MTKLARVLYVAANNSEPTKQLSRDYGVDFNLNSYHCF